MYSLNKSERLCSKKLIDELLLSKLSFVKYPFRVIFNPSTQRGDFPARIAISVSKKKFKRAVKRNRIKRLIREAYRLNKINFYQNLPEEKTIDILFIYLDQTLPEYHKIEKAMQNSMHKILSLLHENQ